LLTARGEPVESRAALLIKLIRPSTSSGRAGLLNNLRASGFAKQPQRN